MAAAGVASVSGTAAAASATATKAPANRTDVERNERSMTILRIYKGIDFGSPEVIDRKLALALTRVVPLRTPLPPGAPATTSG
ncbi:hypothetical protein L3i22_083830 [Actinoplanes sp. L3-i22]|nr:hypothetical protein L3i22_083830 [Actinoplanes sp. L3-i22]